jgi:TonB-linked SusC/RagA family outer membrane protein
MKKKVLNLLTPFSKILTYYILLQYVGMQWGLAGNGQTQTTPISQTYLKLDKSLWAMKELFARIESKTSYRFTYPDHLLNNQEVRIESDNKRASVGQILQEVSAITDLQFRQINNSIYVGKKVTDPPLLSLPESGSSLQLVTGKVTSVENPEGLPGVSVTIKGTTEGTATNINGEYSIKVPGPESVLVFSYIGHLTEETQVGTRTVINQVLYPNIETLQEVVVVGFGTQKKATVTGAISSVSTKDLVQSPVANISNSLVGRMPGLFAVQGSGEPGNDKSTLRIRGVSTFSGAADPLILVNGVEVSNYNNIDPNEIENLTILKDASATAIYGIRGANGVMLITTKRGKVGPPQLSYTANLAITSFTALRKGMNSYDYARSYNEALKNDSYITGGYSPKFSEEDLALYQSGEDPILHPNSDWYSLMLKPQALQTQHNISINGGTEKVKYFASAGFFSQGGQFNNTDLIKDFDANRKYKRYNFRSSFDFDVTKQLKVALDVSSQTENLTGSNSQTNRIIETIGAANPVTSPGFVGDKIVNVPGLGTVINPVTGLFSEGYRREFRNFLQGSVRLDYKLDFITDGFSMHGLVNYQNNNTETLVNRRQLITYNAVRLPDNTINLIPQGIEQPFTFSQTIGKNRRAYAEFGFDYKRAFGDHYVTALINYNQTKRFDPELAFLVPNGYQGVVGRATYGYKERYLAEFTFGYNGTENFAEGKRFGFFPAYSLGWVLSEESFFPKNDIVSYIKLRGSRGAVGNDRIGSDRFLYRPSAYTISTTTASAGGYYFGELGSTLTGYNYSREGKLGNPDVTWERAIKQNIGVEMSFWKSRISLTVDVFSEQRNNILASLGTVPVTLGATLPALNLGRMNNRGFDGDITYNDRIGDVSFWVKGNFTFARNKVEFQDEIKRPFSYQYRTGQRYGQFFGLVADGLYNTWEEVNDANRPASIWNSNKIQPGDIRYKDVNGDGIINEDDVVPIGYSNFPEKIFGISFGGNYKGFDLSVLFQGASNVSLAYNRRQIRGFFENSGAASYLIESWSAERYEQGLPIKFPRFSEGNYVHNYQASTYWIRDASYVRLKNVEIGYNIPQSVLTRLRVSAIRFYVNANNLYTWSSVLKGVDPELSGTEPGSTQAGISNEEPYPLTRTINFGLNLKF